MGGDGGLLVLPEDGGASILDLARAQNERLEAGETLLQMPRPISAVPREPARAQTCWPGSRIQVEALPGVLVWLDLFSLHSELDVASFDPEFQPILMEAALSPDRIERCLTQIGTPYALRLASVSAFLAESRRNAGFAAFLFRNVPTFEIDLVGVSLAADRFVQTPDGRKLREGSAPDLGSRLSAIGDRGALFRVESGWSVRLYPDTISWRVLAE
jgi:hypothetical protein